MWLLQRNILLKKDQQQSKAREKHKAVARDYNMMSQFYVFLFPAQTQRE